MIVRPDQSVNALTMANYPLSPGQLVSTLTNTPSAIV